MLNENREEQAIHCVAKRDLTSLTCSWWSSLNRTSPYCRKYFVKRWNDFISECRMTWNIKLFWIFFLTTKMILQQIYILFDHTSGLIHHWSITLIFKDMFIYNNFVAQIPWNHWKWSYFQPAFIALSNFALFQANFFKLKIKMKFLWWVDLFCFANEFKNNSFPEKNCSDRKNWLKLLELKSSHFPI